MGKQIYFTEEELRMIKRCVDHIDPTDYDENEREPLLLLQIDKKIDKALKK